jgi:RimJ/RimL family protein N-acetyltransferase
LTVSARGRELLVALKASAGSRGPVLGIPVGRPLEAFLRPVATRKEDVNAEDVRLLTRWRNHHVRAFLTEFWATQERTERWLTEVVGPDDTRILFMIDDAEGRVVGYTGLAFIDWERGSAEWDAIVRGDKADPETIARALRAMSDWGRGQLGLRCQEGRVRSDNRALKYFLRKGAFAVEEAKRVPLRKVEEAGMTRWVEDPSLPGGSEPSLVYLKLRDAFSEDWGTRAPSRHGHVAAVAD